MFASACMHFLPIILTYNKLIEFRNHPNKSIYCCCKQKVEFLVICKCIIAIWLAGKKWGRPKYTFKILWSHASLANGSDAYVYIKMFVFCTGSWVLTASDSTLIHFDSKEFWCISSNYSTSLWIKFVEQLYNT